MMEFEMALYVNLVLFTLYTILLVVFSIDEAKRGKKGKAMHVKKAA